MGLRALIERILQKSAEPAEPARSVFGPRDDRDREDRAKARDYEFEIEKQKGWRQPL